MLVCVCVMLVECLCVGAEGAFVGVCVWLRECGVCVERSVLVCVCVVVLVGLGLIA